MPTNPRLAVLIDADNTSPRHAEGLFREITSLGEASVRRIYGDFSSQRLRGWSDRLAGLAIVPHQQFANTIGKNSSDIALVIDAMDLLHSGRFDGFVLVSSDSDFARLASRIREQGLDVYGIGEQKTPESFRRACKRFIFVENLGGAEPSTEAKPAAVSKQAEAAIPLIEAAMRALGEDEDWHGLGRIGSQLIANDPDFDPRSYGAGQLGRLIEKTGRFELDRSASPIRVRRKQQAAETAARPETRDGEPAVRTRSRGARRTTPKAETKRTEASTSETTRSEAPRSDARRSDARRSDAGRSEAPRAAAPTPDTSKPDAPNSEAPKSEASKSEAPKPAPARAPATERPATTRPATTRPARATARPATPRQEHESTGAALPSSLTTPVRRARTRTDE